MESGLYYYDYPFLGSLMFQLGSPSKRDINKGMEINEWRFKHDINEEYVLTKKSQMTSWEMTEEWIDALSEFFDKHIINDAKRIARDVRLNLVPTSVAVSSVYLSCSLNDKPLLFEQNFYNIKKKMQKILRKGLAARFKTNLVKNADLIKENMPKEKLKHLEEIDYLGD